MLHLPSAEVVLLVLGGGLEGHGGAGEAEVLQPGGEVLPWHQVRLVQNQNEPLAGFTDCFLYLDAARPCNTFPLN